MDDFEKELKEAFERRPAPPSLKNRILQERNRRRTASLRTQTIWWQRLAASLLLAAVFGGGFEWRQTVERRKGEEARRQVMIALRITGHALNQMNSQLESHDHSNHE